MLASSALRRVAAAAPARAAAATRASRSAADPLAAPALRVTSPFLSSSQSPLKMRILSAKAAEVTAAPTSLYGRLGADAIKLVTSMLFDKLLADPDLGHFFEAETLPKHKAIVSRFLIGAMGGPDEYKGRNMVDAHIGLVDLRYPEDFLIVAGALSDVLSELSVPKQEADDVMALVGTLEPDFKKIAKFRKMMEEDAEKEKLETTRAKN